MLIAVTISSLSFVIIIATFIFAISVMFVKGSSNINSFNDFLKIDFFSIQGEIEFEADDFNIVSWAVFLLNSIMLPIILVNFLIAKMSNRYEELELHEAYTSYIEKAKLILEIEYFYMISQIKKIAKGEINNDPGYTFIVRNSQNDYAESEELNIHLKIEENME